MRDGRTRRLAANGRRDSLEEFRRRFRASLVVVSGEMAGSEISLTRPQMTVGRGPGVDLALEDAAMSREHAAFEFSHGGFRVRDLGSTNGVLVNGAPVPAADLSAGDRVQVGEHAFQLVVEERPVAPRVHVIPEEA